MPPRPVVSGVLGKLSRVRGLLPELSDYVGNAWVEITLTGLGFVSGIVLTRGLGPAGRGQLAAAMMWPATIGVVCSLGLQHAFAYAAGVGWAHPHRLRALALRFTLILGVPATVVYWAICPWLMNNQFGDDVSVPRVFSLFIPLSLYTGLLLPVYQGVGSFGRWNIGRLFRSGTWTVAVVVLGTTTALTVANLLSVQLVILVVLAGFLALFIPNNKSDSTGHREVSIGPIMKYGLAIYISGLAYTVNQQLDQLLLSLWVTPAELGQYAAAATLSGVMLLIPSIVGPIAFSKIARAYDVPGNQRRQIRGVLVATGGLLVPAGLVTMILAPWITRVLYGSSYLVAGQLLRILAPSAVFLGFAIALSDILRGSGRPMYATYGALLGAVITTVGLLLLLPSFGIWGAAWISLIAYAAMMVLQALLLWTRVPAFSGS